MHMLAIPQPSWPISEEVLRHYVSDMRMSQRQIGNQHGISARTVKRLMDRYEVVPVRPVVKRGAAQPKLIAGPPDLAGIPPLADFRPPHPKKLKKDTLAAIARPMPVEVAPALPAPVAAPAQLPVVATPVAKSRLVEVRMPKTPLPAEDNDVRYNGYLMTENEIAALYGSFRYSEVRIVNPDGKTTRPIGDAVVRTVRRVTAPSSQRALPVTR